MGNQNNKNNRNNTNATNSNFQSQQMKCPRCGFMMPHNTNVHEFAEHIRTCLINQNQQINNQPLHKPILVQRDNSRYEKFPIDYSMTKFEWKRVPEKQVDRKILEISNTNQIKKMSFQEKQFWFRTHLQKRRIRWQNGADWMKLQRTNILMSSLIQYKKINMHKEVKIQFIGQKVNDAGGLLRQWIHMVTKELFDDSTGIFIVGNCEDIVYRLKWDEDLDQQFSGQLLQLFGAILGKCIFERIPMLCHLDRTILRQLCDDPVKIQDIYGYDSELYKNWTFILETENVEDIDVYFVMQKTTGDTVQQIQLIQDGKNIQVTNGNRFKYIDKCIQAQTTRKVQRSIGYIKKGLHKIIPNGLLNVFHPYEIEMILYGVPFIDLKEWRQNTIYKAPYAANHKIIVWFWKVMEEFDQDQLAKILHFCTGSSRTPVHGFKRLESNRGNYSKFLIQRTNFTKQNPYPKGHTCFNRMELPEYKDLDTLRTYLTAISKNNLDGIFGLD